jgi:hypothetical protein
MQDNGRGASPGSGDPIGPGELPGDCDYDDPVRDKTISLSDALKREQVKEQMIINDMRVVELQKARDDAAIRRGTLFDKTQVEERDRRFEDAVMTALATVSELAASLVEPDKKSDARAKAKEWINGVRTQLAEAMAK